MTFPDHWLSKISLLAHWLPSSDHSTAQLSGPLIKNWQRFVEERHLALQLLTKSPLSMLETGKSYHLKSKNLDAYSSLSPSLSMVGKLRCKSILSGMSIVFTLLGDIY